MKILKSKKIFDKAFPELADSGYQERDALYRGLQGFGLRRYFNATKRVALDWVNKYTIRGISLGLSDLSYQLTGLVDKDGYWFKASTPYGIIPVYKRSADDLWGLR